MQVAVVELEGIKRAFSNSTSEISESEEIIVGVGEILERSTGPRTAWGGGDLVDRICWRTRSRWPLTVAAERGGLRETSAPVKPGTVIQPSRMALRKVGRGGEPNALCHLDTKVASFTFRMA